VGTEDADPGAGARVGADQGLSERHFEPVCEIAQLKNAGETVRHWQDPFPAHTRRATFSVVGTNIRMKDP
jgi:hypothetical protein